MNMEAQATTGVAKNEGEEKQANFEANAARAAEVQKEIAEAAASGDFAKIAELSQEGQQLQAKNQETIAADQQEANEMNAEMDTEKARQEAEAKQREAEEAAARAEQARLDAEKAVADQSAAEKLAAEIKGGAVSGESAVPEQPMELSAFDKAVAENKKVNEVVNAKREERLNRLKERIAHSREKSPAERLKLYLEENGDEFCSLSSEDLNRAIQDIRRAQGVENYEMFTQRMLPDGQFISHNGSVLIRSGDKYYWTRNQSRVDEIRALGFQDGDSGIGVPFANTALDDFNWVVMKRPAQAVEDTLNREIENARYEVRNKQD